MNMGELTLSDLFGAQPGSKVYVDGDFSFVSHAEAIRLAKVVAKAMQANEAGAGENVIRQMAFSMPPERRGAFLGRVGDAFGGTRAYLVVDKERTIVTPGGSFVVPEKDVGQVGGMALTRIGWTKKKPPEPIETVIILPTGPYKPYDGEQKTYTFQTYSEETQSKGNEAAVEIYVTTEGGMNVPVPFMSISVKAGVKVSSKVYKRNETRTGVRTGVQISKSYVIRSIRQRVMTFGAANTVEDIGFIVERKEVGDTVGPFWPMYNLSGVRDPKAAREQTDEAVNKLIEDTAVDLANRYRQ